MNISFPHFDQFHGIEPILVPMADLEVETHSSDDEWTLGRDLLQQLFQVGFNKLLDLHARMVTDNSHPAVIDIATQMVNDYVDLADSLLDGRGRAATRTARALIEECATLKHLLADDGACKRYVAHRAVADHLMDRLPQNSQTADKDGVKSREIGYQEALAEYGPQFERQWSVAKITELVRSYTPEFWDYYKVSSMVVHSAGAGIRGSLALRDGHSVYRVGSNWQLCPDAYRWGLLTVAEAASALSHSDLAAAKHRVTDFFNLLLGLEDKYRSSVLEWDDTLWPQGVPLPRVPVMALARDGVRKWYLADWNSESLILCDEPVEVRGISSGALRLAEHILAQSPPQVRWVGVIAWGTDLYSRGSHAPLPFGAMFERIIPGDKADWSAIIS